jgi:outer membrane phospholipase A
MRWFFTAVLVLNGIVAEASPDWIIGAATDRVRAGERFELLVASRTGGGMPQELRVRVKAGPIDGVVTLQAEGAGLYAGTLPAGVSGAVTLTLEDQPSTVLVLVAAPRTDAVQAITGRVAPEAEPPLSENDPMYFIVGGREGYSARFQLSFKYRLFDLGSGFGAEQPWLSGLYFGYTQNSLWDLSSESKAFRDTTYRPSLFWRWQRKDEKTFFDAVRAGIEHESNGRDGPRSRSLNIVFVRPEWHWRGAGGHRLEIAPKFYGYFDHEENPDIHHYRGYADWRVRYDAAGDWIATGTARVGTSGKGSLLVDFSKRTRDLKFGPVSGYWHVQYFNGYGEDLLDYNVRRKSQIRVGFAIVP